MAEVTETGSSRNGLTAAGEGMRPVRNDRAAVTKNIRRQTMKFYHAAPKRAMEKIVGEGRIRKSWDGEVYLCKKPEDSCKFLVMRGMRKMSVIEVNIDENKVKESHDHAEAFFRCKAYIHAGDIELKGNENVWDYEFAL